MPTRVRYQRWARQPAAAVPLSTILRPQFLAAWDFRRNLAAGRDASTYTTSGVAETAGRFGRGLQFSVGGPGTGQVLHSFADAAQFSCVVAGEFGSTGGGNALGRVVSTFDGANGYDLYFDGSTFDYGCTFVGSGRASWSYALPSAERVSVIAISHDASSAANSPILYVNGSRRTLTVNTAASGSRVAHGGTLGIGCRPDSTARQFEGSLYVVGAWQQALSERALADLTLNPWQLFAPRQIRVPVAAGGPSLPTLSASTFKPATLTATGWTPRVTAS